MRHGVLESVLVVLIAVGFYLGLPALTIWGWVRWSSRTQPRAVLAILSLIGFTLGGWPGFAHCLHHRQTGWGLAQFLLIC